MNKIKSNILQYLTAVLLVFGLSGNAAADNGCVSLQTNDTGKLGSQASCADFNMNGCVVGSGESGCTYTGNDCNFEVAVSPPVGDADSTTFSVGGLGCQVRKVIAQGNQRGNYCLFTYFEGIFGDTVTTLSDKGQPIAHKKLEVCTDEVVVVLGKPVARITKTIARAFENEAGEYVFDCSEAADSAEMIAPTMASYCYALSNDGQSPLDQVMVLEDNGTPDDPNDDIIIDDIGSLPAGATVLRDSGVVMVTNAGEVISTATVSGLHQGADCDTCSDSDTARLNVEVACDAETQATADESGEVTESRGPENTTRCSPSIDNDPNTMVRSTAMLCDGNCVLRPECVENTAACKSPCVPSGNWNYPADGFGGGACTLAEPTLDKLAGCQEVIGNPGNNGCNIEKAMLLRSDGRSNVLSRNPTIYYFPSSGGGDSTGTIYCILNPGENASVCPRGSFVF